MEMIVALRGQMQTPFKLEVLGRESRYEDLNG